MKYSIEEKLSGLDLNDEVNRQYLMTFYKVKKETFDLIEKFNDIVESIYPNHWDLQITLNRNYSKAHSINCTFNYVIYFPNITIRNSNKVSHNITDLYVRFSIIDYNNISIGSLSGLRTSFTYNEYITGYIHSHLGNFRPNENLYYSSFCTGVSEINDLSMILNSDLSNNHDLLKMYLLEIKSFVEWESIEGVPYKYFERINKYENGRLSTLNQVSDSLLRNIDRFVNTLDITKMNLTFTSSKIVISNIEEVIETGDSSFFNSNYLCYKLANGEYATTIIEPKISPIRSLFKFKNKPLNIKQVEKKPIENLDTYIHPSVVQIIKNKLEYEYTKKAITNRTFL